MVEHVLVLCRCGELEDPRRKYNLDSMRLPITLCYYVSKNA
jgi:hypothetical protein